MKNVCLYIRRNWKKNLIIILVMMVTLVGILSGIGMYAIAVQGEKDAFRYNGHAFILYDNENRLGEEEYNKLLEIDSVVGVNDTSEYIVTPNQLENVKDHEGEVKETIEPDERYNSEVMVLMAEQDISLDSYFYWEKSVSMVEGDFPDAENQGVIVESRFAELNQLHVGDEISFDVNDMDKTCHVKITGIYKVDSDFIVTEDNDMGDAVYVCSPYNTIYTNYKTVAEQLNIEEYNTGACLLFVDSIDNVEATVAKIMEIYGERFSFYDNYSGYLDGDGRIVTIMKNYAQLILVYAAGIGILVLLIVLSIFAKQYQNECGIYMALGYSRVKILMQYFCSILMMGIMALLGGVVLFTAFSSKIVSVWNGAVTDTYDSTGTISSVISPYEIPSIGQEFSVDLDIMSMLQAPYIIAFLVAFLLILILAIIIPCYSIFAMKPRQLLNEVK